MENLHPCVPLLCATGVGSLLSSFLLSEKLSAENAPSSACVPFYWKKDCCDMRTGAARKILVLPDGTLNMVAVLRRVLLA